MGKLANELRLPMTPATPALTETLRKLLLSAGVL
jgi:hypothetical protein